MTRAARVSFCMIVRNGAATLATCLRSVAPLCEEMIVVDTGSDDDSPGIARSFGARVVHVRWPGDFAAARNLYLEHARCPWVLSLDADEALGEVDAHEFLRALAGQARTAFLFRIRHYFEGDSAPALTLPSAVHREGATGARYMVSRIVRLFPRVTGVRYCFPVHESVVPALRTAGVRVAACAVPIRHTGYLSPGRDPHAKSALYRSLGERKIEEFPDHFAGYLELGKVYLHAGELVRAARMFAQAVRLAPRSVDAHYSLALTLQRQERFAECGRLLRAALRRFPFDPDIRAMVARFRQTRPRPATVSFPPP